MNASDDHEPALAEALVDLADTLVDDYDVIDLLDRLTQYCVRLLPIDAAGLVLSDQRGHLRVVSSSAEQARVVELFQLEADEGPCLDSFRTGQPVTAADLRAATAPWPRFTERAIREGFRSVHALPMRLRSQTIGALNLFRAEPGLLPHADLRVGQALADMATIGILHQQTVRRADVLAEQLQGALNSRVIIEQAKGVLSGRGQLDMAQAFTLLRNHARNTNQRLSDLALAVIEDNTTADLLLHPTVPPSQRHHGDNRQP
ncbi:GAF and ANTAR domain-containing protein [Amycolatopsis dongchuanensis]|uniref:GAF and ANTAR domain-containing protein n=1 Tax=Amycolatopsis dongchuanensis TaxID=1070866 RepID=A0ABP8VGH9_9PSEU